MISFKAEFGKGTLFCNKYSDEVTIIILPFIYMWRRLHPYYVTATPNHPDANQPEGM